MDAAIVRSAGQGRHRPNRTIHPDWTRRRLPRRHTVRIVRRVIALAAAVLAAGCGGDDTSATERWADDVCSATSTWQGSVEDAADTIREGGGEGIETAVDDVVEATQELADDLKGLGSPETEAGDQAEASVERLADQLSAAVDQVRAAGDEGTTLQAVAAATAALATLQQDVQRTLDELRGLDAGGELEDAFDNADSCDELRSED
jgi:hypothetical protein